MSKAYIFYNPLAGNGRCKEDVSMLECVLPDEIVYCDMTKSETYERDLFSLEPGDYLILCGGDGTLNRFVNLVGDMELHHEIFYFPLGTGNDFATDLGHKYADNPFSINEYIRNLPSVAVNGKTFRFLNGIGYGLDGFCCEEGDKHRQNSEEKTNYASIAVRGLLRDYQPTSAVVTVDGVAHRYKKVWLAPTMFGRFYGGGIMPTPNQHREDTTQKLSVMVVHDINKLHALALFPSIFKGEHVRHKKYIDIFEGNTISVTFDRPTPLQIDGELIRNVSAYTASVSLH